MAAITIAYSNHRPETLEPAAKIMQQHEVIFLEEAPNPGFSGMLRGQWDIDEYVAGLDTEYPEFSKKSCKIFHRLTAKGIRFEQIEPFIERLIHIHELFAEDISPEVVQRDPLLCRVYAVEKEATRTLIDYYSASAEGTFAEVMIALKLFAKADAKRFRLRDTMRAKALAKRIHHFKSCYIEAGTMHFWLNRALRHHLTGDHEIKTLYPMADVTKSIAGRKYLLGPGDDLTLRYIFHPEAASPKIDLLAARSLIYNKIIIKDELVETDDAHPHTLDEFQALEKVNRLEIKDCEYLFPYIRRLGTSNANSLMDKYFDYRRSQRSARIT